MEERSGHEEKSKLCVTCQKSLERLIDPPIGTEPGRLHHKSLGALETAANEGCLICNVLFQAFRQDQWLQEAYQTCDSEGPKSFKVEVFWIAAPIDADIAPTAQGNVWARFNFKLYNGGMRRAADVGFEGPPAISDGVLGRRTSLTPDFQLARARIHECSQRHHSCPRLEPRPLPTRVIELGENIRHGSRLVETRGEHGQYLALSHCWGNVQPRPLMTTSDNISKMTEQIPFESLSKTFQEAMIVTRQLGYRYLWIDMFCIVQDSVADWQRECSKMASIFANADLTIAASTAKDSNAGFLQERPVWRTNITEWVQHLSPECQDQDGSLISFNFQVNNIPIQAMITSLPGVGHPTYYSVVIKNDVLSTRAWAVQERLLPARILSFYESQTIFECNTCLWYEKMHNPLLHRNEHNYVYEHRTALVPKDFLNSDDYQTIMDRWFSILERYTSCSITMADDRLPALSGVVERIQERTGDKYTAGLWHGHFLQGLTWRAIAFLNEYTITQYPDTGMGGQDYGDQYLHRFPRVKHACTMYIPSWSWASCAYSIKVGKLFDAEEVKEYAEIVEIRSTAASLDRFGNVTSATVRITAHLRTLEWRATSTDIAETLFLLREDGKSLPVMYPDRVFRDRVVPGDKGQLTCCLISSDILSRIILLVLEPVLLPNTYQRIGLIPGNRFTCWPNQPKEYIDREEIVPWFLEAERSTIDII